MKKPDAVLWSNHLFIFVVISFFSFSSAKAQTSVHPNGFSFKWALTDYNFPINHNNFKLGELSQGGTIGYHRFINKSLNLDIPFRFGYIHFPTSDTTFARRQPFVSGDLTLNYQFNNDYILRQTAVFYPYLFGGFGFSYRQPRFENSFDFHIPFGAGFNLKFFERGYFQIQSEYRLSLKTEFNNMVHSIGMVLLLKKHPLEKERPENIKTKRQRDSDNDGILDEIDECPFLAGSGIFNGCPDTDDDGVADKDDNCPEVKGDIDNYGCPLSDSDGDGVADLRDECPNEMGSKEHFGCPDTDGDGIIDKNDECPKVRGPISGRGCPTEDVDDDGIPNEEDECMEEAGPLETNGCPDTDGDGVADKDDACPNNKGIPATEGCPDTDNDLVPDNLDKCPDVTGPAMNDGCPLIHPDHVSYLEEASQRINFQPGSAQLAFNSDKVLAEIAEIVKRYPYYQLKIEGHTDNVGNDEANLRLSENRAKVCLDFLGRNGIPRDKMTATGYGETKPKASNSTREGRSENRRVEFLLMLE
ncbi:MAG: OmpA family protein [Bacteroidota bacterium]